MVQIINSPVSGSTVTVENDELYVTNTGSITNSGLALNLKGDVLAFINGDVTGNVAIQALGDGNRVVVIGAFAHLQYSDLYSGIKIGGNTIVRNEGVINGDSLAVYV